MTPQPTSQSSSHNGSQHYQGNSTNTSLSSTNTKVTSVIPPSSQVLQPIGPPASARQQTSTLQQQQSQVLPGLSTTLSQGTSVGLATAIGGGGGGGGSGGTGSSSSSGTSLTKIVTAQLSLLLSTIKEDKWEQQAATIRQLLESNGMEVYHKFLRRLISSHLATIFSPTGRPPDSSYRLLVQQVKELANSPQESKAKFADSISGGDSDIFRDFDLASFMKHFDLDGLERSILALGFKSSEKNDLRSKAHDIITVSFQPMLETLANPARHPEMTFQTIALFLQQYYSEPLPSFFDTTAKLSLSYAARTRYRDSVVPDEIMQVTEPIERLRQQESLVGIFRNAGPASTSSVEACRRVLRMKWQVELTEDEVGDVFTMIATGPKPSDWNGTVLVSALTAENIGGSFDWSRVIKSFDRPDFFLKSVDGFAVILSALTTALANTNNKFDISKLWGGRWQNPHSQLSVFRAYMSIPPERFDVLKIPGLKKVMTQDDFSSAPSAIKALAESLEGQKLISTEALSSLFHLGLDPNLPQEVQDEVIKNIDRAVKLTPELLMFGALLIPRPWAPHVEHLINQLFEIFFTGHTSYQLVFWKLWNNQKLFVAQKFIEFHNRDPLNLTRIFEIANGLRCVNELLEVQNAGLVLDLAALAARRECLNLDKWLQDMIAKHGMDFVVQCYRFLKFKADAECLYNREGGRIQTVSLRVGQVNTFLQVLEKSIQPPIEQHHIIVETQRIAVQAYPRLINLGQGHDAVILANNADGNTFLLSIDQKMQQMFKKLYSGEIQIRDMVQQLRILKDSDDAESQDLFACMIHGLFDEYHCYPSYPLSALATTAVLFGSIIAFKLIDGIPLNVALGMILEAVKHTSDHPMYKFGLQALLNFPSRFSEWRGYCQLLLQIPGLRSTEIHKMASEVVTEQHEQPQQPLATDQPLNGSLDHAPASPPMLNGDLELEPSQPAAPPPFTSIHTDPPLHDSSWYSDPAEEVQDKVLFIVNNVSTSNLDSKLRDLREQLQEEYYQWFADYLVVHRAKLEPNYHQLYLELLDRYGNKGLTQEVLRETYINVVKLLNSEATIHSMNERVQLKNLASWLGGLTVARDKPIKYKNISFRDLLIEGYHTNRLIVVVPFTCKVLEQCTESTVFKPPNPWLMAILRLLVELYQFAELKLNLKFEIEVLCKKLSLDIKKLEPSTDIRDRPLVKEEEIPLALDQIGNDLSGLELERQHGRFSPTSMTAKLANVLHNQIHVNSALAMLIQHPELKRIMLMALDRAIREIISPVVERSVTIASISTAQLIKKDFATEPSEEKMLNAAHSMVKTAAAGLAQVTCKEPLRMSIANNLRQILLQQGFAEGQIPEPAITMCVNDNIDICCHIIEKAAQERAIPEIDDALAGEYSIRRKHRESRTNTPFFAPDTSRYSVQFLPEPFRLKAGGLTPQQLSVYEDFSRMPRSAVVPGENVRDVASDYLIMPPQVSSEPVATSLVQGRMAQPHVSPLPPVQQPSVPNDQRVILDEINEYLEGIRKAVQELPDHFVTLPKDSAIPKHLNTILEIAQGAGTVQIPVRVAQRICNLLFTSENSSRIEIELLVTILQRLCEMSSLTNKEVVTWLSQQDDDRMFNVPVIVMLVKKRLLSISHLDATLARWITERRAHSLEFFTELINEMTSKEPPMAYRCNFIASMSAVGHLLANESNNIGGQSMLKEFDIIETFDRLQDDRFQMHYIFAEWVQLYLHPLANGKQYATFVFQLNRHKILANTGALTSFLRTCVEVAVEDYESAETEGRAREIRNDHGYISVDALAKLIISIVRYHSEENERPSKAELLRSMISIIIVLFNHSYETGGDNFPQKAFFRLFSTLLYEYKRASEELRPWHRDIMFAFSHCMLVLRPAHFPSFTLCWISMVSHRFFMPQILSLHNQEGWPEYIKILEIILDYLGLLLSQPELPMVVRILYRGILRMLLVLHHDFPEFLAQYHFFLCEAIPPNCVQLRNLILSAYPPSNSDLPDPFRQGLKVDLLPEMRIAPKIAGDVFKTLRESGLQQFLDSYFSGLTSLEDTFKAITEVCEVPASRRRLVDAPINTKVLNSLVLFVGVRSLEANRDGFQPQALHGAIMIKLGMDLNPEARYYFLNGLANHLRDPNSHTNYFSGVLLNIFGQSQNHPSEQDIRQQITRVLLERLIVHRPHPWGLIITLLELLKSTSYEFWNLSFIKAAPEVAHWVRALANHLIKTNVNEE